MAGRQALLTGATGFVGGHVARALVSDGWRVRALARGDPARAPLLRGVSIDIVPGDLSSPASLDGVAAGCDAVVHLAGIVKARTLEEYRDGNARATERLVSAARRDAPEALFVHVSSQAAAGPARGGVPVGEGDPARPISWYGLSKLEGENAVRSGWNGPWIVVRPGVVFGAGDRGLLTYFRLAARGVIPVPVPRSRIQIIEAGRAALGIARAAARPELAGRTGFLCDPAPVALGDLARAIARLPERPARVVAVPDFVVRLAGAIETVRERATRRSRPFNADKAREILVGEWLSDSTLAADLEVPPPGPLPRELSDTWQWYEREGWLPL